MDYHGFWYSTNDSWQRYFGGLSFNKKIGSFYFKLGYINNFLNQGKSPFLYDVYKEQIENEINSLISYKHKKTEFGAEFFYQTLTKDFRDVDIFLEHEFHCWKTKVNYRIVRKEFSLGFELTPSIN